MSFIVAIENYETRYKNMKKTISIVALLFIIVCLSSCAKEKNFIYYSIREDVASVEIIHVISQWDLEYEVIYELKENEDEVFLEKLGEISYVIALFGDPGTIDDAICVKITYNSGDFDIVTSSLIVKYDANRTEIKWEELIMDSQNVDKLNELIDEYKK
jgi:hypothetical protein